LSFCDKRALFEFVNAFAMSPLPLDEIGESRAEIIMHDRLKLELSAWKFAAPVD
jgi:hypothetical protein